MKTNTEHYKVDHEALLAYAERFKKKRHLEILLKMAIAVIAALLDGERHPTLYDLESEFFIAEEN